MSANVLRVAHTDPNKVKSQEVSVKRNLLSINIMSLQMALFTGKTVVICLSYQQTNHSLPLLKYLRNLPTRQLSLIFQLRCHSSVKFWYPLLPLQRLHVYLPTGAREVFATPRGMLTVRLSSGLQVT